MYTQRYAATAQKCMLTHPKTERNLGRAREHTRERVRERDGTFARGNNCQIYFWATLLEWQILEHTLALN